MEQSRPCSGGEKDRESQPSVTTVCLSGAACLQLRWNQGEICAALIMSLVWIINESCSPGTRAPTEPINPPPPPHPLPTHPHAHRDTQTRTHTRRRERNTLWNIHIRTPQQWHIVHADTHMSNKHAATHGQQKFLAPRGLKHFYSQAEVISKAI